MNDVSFWAALGGAVGAGTVAREIAKLVTRWLGYRTTARKTDMEVSGDLRDALLMELSRLRERVGRLETRADLLHEQLRECEERSADQARENAQLREHAERLAERVGQLEARA